MTAKLLGVPYAVWGIGCLILTIVWVFVWPSDKAAALNGWRLFIVRWFHALVWLLLAIAAFITGFDVLGGASTGKPIALLSLPVYLIFMATLLTSQRR